MIAVSSRSFSQDPFLRESLSRIYPDVKFNETGGSLEGAALVNFLRGADKAIVALEKIDGALLSQLPSLKLISKYGVGLDNIDFGALENHGVQLAWKGGVNRRAVAELALHFILGAVRGSFDSHHEIQRGKWTQFKGRNLSGKTVGILGLGHVGQELVPFLKPFDVQILAFDILDRSLFCAGHGIKQVAALPELLAASDVITIHLPHTSKTHRLLGVPEFSQMKSGSFLINTARGGIVDEAALLGALKSRHVGAAAFDVFEKEPFENAELQGLSNFYFTGHIGGSSLEAIRAMGEAAIAGLSAGVTARPENFFNYPM